MPDPRRQFRILYRDFLVRLVDLEVLSSRGDAHQLIGQFGALLAALSLVLTIYIVPRYGFTTLSREQVALAAWGDQEFLISTTMTVVGLFAVIAWDAAFPSRQDSLVLNQLPLTPATILRAKIAALVTGLGISILAVNAGTGLIYPFVTVAPGSGILGAPRAALAYWITMAAAGSFVFCWLLALQGMAALLFRYRLFLRVSNVLQLGAFFAVLGAYFLTPGPSDLSLADEAGRWWIARLPSFWFVGLYGQLNGAPNPRFGPFAGRAAYSVAAGFMLAITTYASAYRRTMRRLVEEPDIAPATTHSWWANHASPAPSRSLLSLRLVAKPLERALLLFIGRTLARSRQHRALLAAFAGLGLAIALTFARGILYGSSQLYAPLRRFGFEPPKWFEPNPAFMTGGFVLVFFAVIGTRAVFSLPATLKANWIFRITAIHSPQAYFKALRKTMFRLAAWPVLAALAILYLAIWPPLPALLHIAILATAAAVFVNRSLADFSKIPFACSYLPGKSNLRLKLAPYGFAFLFAAYMGGNIENSLLESPARATVLGGFLMLLLIQSQRRWKEFAGSSGQRLEFEDQEVAEVSPLILSDDSVYSREERYIDVINAPPEPTLGARVKTAAKRAAVVTLIAVAAGAMYERIEQKLHPPPPRIGTLVDIGGRSLNIYCLGEGRPTVVFESGRGGPGYAWVLVQREVARFTRACWYDRAGYGWSDTAPYPHPASAISQDLHRLLHAYGVAPPYVLVGASFGGLIVRVYNGIYPDEVAGMVLVDSSHIDEQEPITPFGGGYLPYFPRLIPALGQILKHTGVLRMAMPFGSGRSVGTSGYTPSELRLMNSFEPRTMAESLQEMDFESFTEARAAGTMGDLPLIVLTAGIHSTRPAGDPVKAREFRAFEDHWIESQQQLARLSTRGVQIVLRQSRHAIQIDRPDVVIEAVREIVSGVRAGQ